MPVSKTGGSRFESWVPRSLFSAIDPSLARSLHEVLSEVLANASLLDGDGEVHREPVGAIALPATAPLALLGVFAPR
jgi:hypothetical protein